MTEKEIRKLSKTELIELLAYQSKKIDELKNKIKDLNENSLKKEDIPAVTNSISREEVLAMINNAMSELNKESEKREKNILKEIKKLSGESFGFKESKKEARKKWK